MRRHISVLSDEEARLKTLVESDFVCSWRPPPEPLILAGDELHVWRASLDAVPPGRLQSLLAPDELQRAARFHFQKDREHFIAARGLLRLILGRYLGRAPEQTRFCYNAHGKPSLTNQSGADRLCFNLSHSQGLVLYALSRGRELGIDLEYKRALKADQQIPERFFSPKEVAALRALPPEMQQAAFFSCWTRKEAYLKAIGQGLMLALDRFEVTLAPGEPAALLSTQQGLEETSRWRLEALAPGPDYAAALAVEGHDWRLKCWQWPKEWAR